MRIYTLGTGHGDSTFSRFNSSTIYEAANGSLYEIDAGAPAEALIRRKGLSIHTVRAVFITHMHDDHAGGLSGLIKQVSKYSKNRTQPFSVYLPEANAINALKNWIYAVHENADDPFVEYHTVNDGLVYEDECISVTAIRTCHLRTKGRTEGDPCSFAYVLYFKEEDKTALHTGDLTADFSDFPKIALERRFDVCLCEATHYPPETAAPILEKAKFDRLIFTHISDRWHIHIGQSWQVENGERDLRDFYRGLPYPFAIAHDGDEFVF